MWTADAGLQVYFSQFRRTPFGMLRLDPQDAGPGYRNIVGIPGGVHSALFKVLQACMPPPGKRQQPAHSCRMLRLVLTCAAA